MLPSDDAVRSVVAQVGRAGTYRLLFSVLAAQRGYDVPAALDHPALAGTDVTAHLAALAPSGEPDPTADLLALGDLHQRLLRSVDRRAAGAWFTPWPLVQHLLDLALEDG